MFQLDPYYTIQSEENSTNIHSSSTKLDRHPNVPTGPIIWFKAKKIQQTFILHLQIWIGSIQPSFVE